MKRKILRSLVVIFVGINMFLSINLTSSNQSFFNLAMQEAKADDNSDSEIFDPDPDDDIIPTGVIPEDGFWTKMLNSLLD